MKASFESIKLEMENGTLHKCMLDKGNTLPVKVLKYLHKGTNIPSHSIHKVIISKMKPILYCNTNTLTAAQDIK